MSIIVLKSGNARPRRLTALLDWLRQARVALSLPPAGAENIPDRFPYAKGRPSGIARDVDRGVEQLNLLHLGWRDRPSQRRR